MSAKVLSAAMRVHSQLLEDPRQGLRHRPRVALRRHPPQGALRRQLHRHVLVAQGLGQGLDGLVVVLEKREPLAALKNGVAKRKESERIKRRVRKKVRKKVKKGENQSKISENESSSELFSEAFRASPGTFPDPSRPCGAPARRGAWHLATTPLWAAGGASSRSPALCPGATPAAKGLSWLLKSLFEASRHFSKAFLLMFQGLLYPFTRLFFMLLETFRTLFLLLLSFFDGLHAP